MKAKEKVAAFDKKAAQRMLYANLYNKPKYDLTKLLTDFSLMSSWFEPCGLVHKEIGSFSGAIPIVNKTGGLCDGLIEDVNLIVSKFTSRKQQPATPQEIAVNAQNFAAALEKAFDFYKDKEKLANGFDTMLKADFNWAKKDGTGPIYQYTELLESMGVLSHATATTIAA